MSQAIEIGRCRMSELEEKQLKLGFPEIEEKDSSQLCCDDKEIPGFSCDWQVERVLLPQPQTLGGDARAELGPRRRSRARRGRDRQRRSGMATSLAGPIGTVMVNPLGGAQLDLRRGPAEHRTVAPAVLRRRRGVGAAVARLQPRLPVAQAAARDGHPARHGRRQAGRRAANARDFTLVQYITNPSQAGLLAGMADAGVGRPTGVPWRPRTSAAASTASAAGPAPSRALAREVTDARPPPRDRSAREA